MFRHLQNQVPAMFRSPADLFDPFASACLMFHTAPMHVPPDFSSSHASSPLARAIDALAGDEFDPDYPRATDA